MNKMLAPSLQFQVNLNHGVAPIRFGAVSMIATITASGGQIFQNSSRQGRVGKAFLAFLKALI